MTCEAPKFELTDGWTVCSQREGKTTVLEVLTTRELGDPFRRDAMKLPQRKLAKYTHTNEEFESRTEQPTDIAGAKN